MQSRILQASLGLLIAAGGNALADLAAVVAARSAGGFRGCDVDIGAGGRFAVLTAEVLVYPAVHVVLGGLAVGLSTIARPAPAYWVVLAAVSVASVFYPGC